MPPEAPGGEEDETRDEGEAGWAAPGLPPREPSGGDEPTAPSAPPPVPPAPPAPSDAWQAPAPGTTPPPAPGPVEPGRTPRRIWLFALIALVGVVAVAAIAGTVIFIDRTVPPYDAADTFLTDLADHHTEAARSQLCAADREHAEAAVSEVTQHFFGGRTVFANPLGVDRDGDRATVEYSIDVRGTDHSRTYDLPMREERGTWRPCPLSG